VTFDRDIVIGLEIHVELDTDTKLFCGCPTRGGQEPNTRTCPICLGMPGSKPVVNRKAIEYALRIAHALECRIAKRAIFSRKSYFYPDLAKNYQITQYEEPIGKDGHVMLKDMRVGITRAHIEEDPASLVHPAGIGESGYVLVDYNRSGNPLCEIVTEPDMSSPQQARDFMKALITILQYIGVFDQKHGIIKADANISIKESGYVRAEVKNITGFKEIERALSYEIDRQRHDLKEHGKLFQETRLWDAARGVTQPLRKKETEEDYGYIFDPDLVPISLDAMSERAREAIPELPSNKYTRYVKELGIAEDDAFVITSDISLTRIFEKSITDVNPSLASKWIRRELNRVLNSSRLDADDVDASQFVVLLMLLEAKKITDQVGQKLLEKLVTERIDVESYVKENSLEAISDSGAIERFCREAIAENPSAVSDFLSGKEMALNFLLGSVMKKSRGKADAKEVKRILEGLIR
jgi:aspartyl-tRNA(Asn)/glutamyl-tRNA(Gln) amidotransferase subunit B